MLTELKSAGLSDNEAKVYFAMLELGPASVLEISARAEVNRPTTYVQIESLKKIGLASTQIKGKKQLFIPESPSHLETVLDKERLNIAQKKEGLEKSLPKLLKIYNAGDEKPIVRYFERKEGLLKMQEEFLKSKEKQIYAISSLDAVLSLFPEHTSSYSERRIKKGIHSKLIYTWSRGELLKRDDPVELREAKFLPEDALSFSSDITIYDDNIAISSLHGKVGGTILTNKGLADSFKSLFNLIWKKI